MSVIPYDIYYNSEQMGPLHDRVLDRYATHASAYSRQFIVRCVTLSMRYYEQAIKSSIVCCFRGPYLQYAMVP